MAGTLLAILVLRNLGIRPAGIHVLTRKVNEATTDNKHSQSFRADIARFDKFARKVRPGQYMTGHMPWDEHLHRYLAEQGFKSIVMIRDPRAILVSRFHYLLGLGRNHLHETLAGLPNDLARYRRLLYGNVEPAAFGLAAYMEQFCRWTEMEDVFTVRFEDLVGEAGGGDSATKLATIEAMARYLGLPMPDRNTPESSAPKRTATLRKGRVDSWREELPMEIRDEVRQEVGAICAAMNYRPE
jgi:hypothetical protein